MRIPTSPSVDGFAGQARIKGETSLREARSRSSEIGNEKLDIGIMKPEKLQDI
jgi:hypothetical protein